MSTDQNELKEISKKLDLLLIILLAKSGLSQRDISKILGISSKTIWKMFGTSYEKIQAD